MLRGKGNVNALAAVMPLVACATASAAHRVVLSLKVRLSLQVRRCELTAAFHGRPNEQAV